MTAEQNSNNSPRMRQIEDILKSFNDSYDALMEIGKIRAQVVQQILEPYRNRTLEEISREAFGARFGGEGPVDLYGEVRVYIGGEQHINDNTLPCTMQDIRIAMKGSRDVQDFVHLWIFGKAPESLHNRVLTETSSRTVLLGEDADSEKEEIVPYICMGGLRVYSEYIFLGPPDAANPDSEPLMCMLDALFFPDILEERRIALLRRCGLGLTGPEEERVRTETRNIQVAWERYAVWQERYGEG